MIFESNIFSLAPLTQILFLFLFFSPFLPLFAIFISVLGNFTKLFANSVNMRDEKKSGRKSQKLVFFCHFMSNPLRNSSKKKGLMGWCILYASQIGIFNAHGSSFVLRFLQEWFIVVIFIASQQFSSLLKITSRVFFDHFQGSFSGNFFINVNEKFCSNNLKRLFAIYWLRFTLMRWTEKTCED